MVDSETIETKISDKEEETEEKFDETEEVFEEEATESSDDIKDKFEETKEKGKTIADNVLNDFYKSIVTKGNTGGYSRSKCIINCCNSN